MIFLIFYTSDGRRFESIENKILSDLYLKLLSVVVGYIHI